MTNNKTSNCLSPTYPNFGQLTRRQGEALKNEQRLKCRNQNRQILKLTTETEIAGGEASMEEIEPYTEEMEEATVSVGGG